MHSYPSTTTAPYSAPHTLHPDKPLRRYSHTPSQPLPPPHHTPVHIQRTDPLPHMSKVQQPVNVIQHHPHHPPRFPHPSQSHLLHHRSAAKQDPIPSVPLPMHPDPVQTFQTQQDPAEADRSFPFGRHAFFDDLAHEDPNTNPNIVHQQPNHTNQDTDQGNTLASVDTITNSLTMQAVPQISSLPLPGISANQTQPLQGVQNVAAFAATSTNLGNAAIVGGASEIAEALGVDRKHPMATSYQRRIRAVPRTRSQQMTEVQRKQRHNEHTRASRSRIDRGLERLKSVIRKVRPHQKVTKKADVLQEAVKLLKEGFRLPATESDDEHQEPQDSSLSV